MKICRVLCTERKCAISRRHRSFVQLDDKAFYIGFHVYIEKKNKNLFQFTTNNTSLFQFLKADKLFKKPPHKYAKQLQKMCQL